MVGSKISCGRRSGKLSHEEKTLQVSKCLEQDAHVKLPQSLALSISRDMGEIRLVNLLTFSKPT